MKSLLLSLTALSLVSLAACQSTSLSQSSDTRNVEVAGAQSRYTLQVRKDNLNDQTPAPANAPYALQGSQNPPFAGPVGTGYQGR